MRVRSITYKNWSRGWDGRVGCDSEKGQGKVCPRKGGREGGRVTGEGRGKVAAWASRGRREAGRSLDTDNGGQGEHAYVVCYTWRWSASGLYRHVCLCNEVLFYLIVHLIYRGRSLGLCPFC